MSVMMRRFPVLFCAALVLAACGSDEKPPLAGTRIPVLQAGADAQLTTTTGADENAPPVSLPDAQTNTNWPQAGGPSTHNPGHVALGGPKLKKIWSRSIGDGSDDEKKLITPPIVADGMVFAANTEGEVVAFDAQKGREIWTVNILPGKRDPSVSAGIVYGGGLLFVTDGVRHVLALDPKTGKRVWSANTGVPVRAAPGFDRGRVYVTTIQDETFALSADDGRVLWRYKGIQERAGLLGAPAPAADGSVVIVAHSSGDVVALRAETGQDAWTDNLTGIAEFQSRAVTSLAGFRGHPVLDGDHVVVGNISSKLVAIHVPTGERVWQREFGITQTPVVAGNSIFVLNASSELVSLVKGTGAVRWVKPLPRFEDPEDREDPIFWHGPILAGGRLIIVGSNEDMYEMAPETGAILRTTSLPDPVMLPPVVTNGVLYILSDNGTLAAYQ